MSRVLAILLVATAGVLADDQCAKFFQHNIAMKCCKGALPTPSPEYQAIYKECKSIPEVNPCDQEMCVATKKGFVTDGKFDPAKIKDVMSKEYEKYPTLITAIIEKCADGDLSKFGTADTCDAVKFRHCVELQLVKTCPDWANDGPCEGLKELSVECGKKYNN